MTEVLGHLAHQVRDFIGPGLVGLEGDRSHALFLQFELPRLDHDHELVHRLQHGVVEPCPAVKADSVHSDTMVTKAVRFTLILSLSLSPGS